MHQLVPRFIIEQFADGKRNGRLSAVTLFVDVSGFTTMTETLMSHGQHGAEILAEQLSTIFDPMLQTVYAYGGFVANFAGDAFYAIFPLDESKNLTVGLSAAWQIRQQMTEHAQQVTPYGTFEVSVKVGVGLAENDSLEWGILPSAHGRHTYYFRELGMLTSADAETEAQGGQITLCQNILRVMGEGVTAVHTSDPDIYRLDALATILPQPDLSPPAVSDSESLAKFAPATVLHMSEQGEFRQTVNLFINPQLNDIEDITSFMQTIASLQERYGGYCSNLTFNDKGALLYLFWGAPLSHENDVERALSFILDLKAESQILFRSGLTTRIAYAGFIGAALREEYTCYSRHVNLAARFMSQAPFGRVWVDDQIAEEEAFIFTSIGELKFKGFSRQQVVLDVQGRSQTENQSDYQYTFVGRDDELSQIQTFIAETVQHQSAQLLNIVGEAGVGKSRLLYEAQKRSSIALSPLKWIYCPTDEILRQPLNPFRYWLIRYFNQRETTPVNSGVNKQLFDQKLEELKAQLADSALIAELDRLTPFLGGLINLRWADSLFESIDPQLRFENTLMAVKTLLQAESQIQPLVLELEDGHWLESDSTRLLIELLQELKNAPLAILVSSRPSLAEDWLPSDLPQQTLRLQQLHTNNLPNFVQSILGQAPSGQLLELIADRTEGNPFFVEQMLFFLREENLLVTVDNEASVQETVPVPHHIRALLVARLDKLSKEVKQVVQAAAVLGREFEVIVLSQMLRSEAQLIRRIEDAEQEAIWQALSQIRYIFRHTLLRDSAYEMQLRARLKALHRLAGESIERIYDGDLEPHYLELAYHFEQAEIREKAVRYLQLAGDIAKWNYQNETAVSLYTRLVQQATAQNDISLILDTYLKILDILILTGDITQLESVATQAEQISAEHNEPAYQAQLLILQGRGYATVGQYEKAQTTLESAQQIIETQLPDHKQILHDWHRASVVLAYFRAEWEVGKTHAHTALELSRELDDNEAKLTALTNLIGISDAISDYQQMRTFADEALTLAKAENRNRELLLVVGNLGMAELAEGRYEQAMNMFEEAVSLSRAIGSRFFETIMLRCTGKVHYKREEYQEAQHVFEHTLNLQKHFSYGSLLSSTYEHLAHALIAQNKKEEAIDIIAENLDHIQQTQIDTEHGKIYLAAALLLANDELTEEDIQPITVLTQMDTNPQSYFEKAIQTSEQVNYLHTLVPALYEFGKYLHTTGEAQMAVSHLQQAFDLTQNHGLKNEQMTIQDLVDKLGLTLSN